MSEVFDPNLLWPAISALVIAGFTYLGAKRNARATERGSSDTLTAELVQEYRAMKEELKKDLSDRVAYERAARAEYEADVDRRFKEVGKHVKQLETYVRWCLAGHKPPPPNTPNLGMDLIGTYREGD